MNHRDELFVFQGTRGTAVNYLTRGQALNKLQVNLKTFRWVRKSNLDAHVLQAVMHGGLWRSC